MLDLKKNELKKERFIISTTLKYINIIIKFLLKRIENWKEKKSS